MLQNIPWKKLATRTLIALAVAAVLRGQGVEVFRVAGACMDPIAPQGTHVLVNKLASVREGDLLVFRRDGKAMVRRVREVSPDRIRVEDASGASLEVSPDERIGRVCLATR